MSKEDKRQIKTRHDDVIAYPIRGNSYINLTNRCTLRCRFCPKFNHQWDVQSYSLRLKHEPTVSDVIEAIGDASQYREVVFCGLGEPTLRLDALLEIAAHLKNESCLIRLNTDGLGNYVHQRDITKDLAPLVDAVSVSLNAQNESVYDAQCHPPDKDLRNEVVNFIRAARSNIADVTLTAIDGLIGVDIDACQQQANELGVKFRRRILDKVG